MQPLNQKQRLFLAALAAGVSLQETLEAHQLKWGTIAAWRRWNSRFRRAHDQALKVGTPKRKLLRMAIRVQLQYGPQFVLAPDLAVLVEDARSCVRIRADGHADASKLASC